MAAAAGGGDDRGQPAVGRAGPLLRACTRSYINMVELANGKTWLLWQSKPGLTTSERGVFLTGFHILGVKVEPNQN